MQRFLADVRVLDLTRLLPGPYASLLLADLGADVVKIEEPGRGDPVRGIPPFVEGRSTRFSMLNRNKRSLALDLKSSEGREIFLKLARDADVILEGYRPGVARRLGIDYERVREANPEIIYCSLTGYGQEGLYRDHVGHDVNYIARAGLLSLTGECPVIPGVPVADLAGAMFAAFSVLAALRARDQGGGGAFLDVSLTDAVVSWLAVHLAEVSPSGEQPDPRELVLTGGFPCYHVYETQDQKYLAVGALEEKFWARLCEALGVPEYASYQFSEEKREEIFQRLEVVFRSRTRDEWLEALDPEEIPVAPVLDLAEVIQDPHLRARGLIRDGVTREIAFPVRFLLPSKGDEEGDRQAPELGEHTHEILSALGYSPAEIDRLSRERVT